MKNEEMARLFSEATPYIQKYHGRTMVIKYGGNAMINESLKNAVMNDLVTLTLLGVRVVLVHGGGYGSGHKAVLRNHRKDHLRVSGGGRLHAGRPERMAGDPGIKRPKSNKNRSVKRCVFMI